MYFDDEDEDILVRLDRYKAERQEEAREARKAAPKARPAGLSEKKGIREAMMAFARSHVGQTYRNGHLWTYAEEYTGKTCAPDTPRRELGFMESRDGLVKTEVVDASGLHRILWAKETFDA